MTQKEYIRERLCAYIHPNVAASDDEKKAIDNAVEAQLAYEKAQGDAEIPGNVQSFSVGNYSVTLAEPGGGAYTKATICPAAWAILYNAGLLRRKLPVAKRL